MKRYSKHGGLIVWGIALILSGSTFAVEERPNIVFLLTDDQAVNTLGCYGNGDVVTPHIDRLAAQGVVFDKHYATTAICMASRVNIMTGLFEFRNGCNFDHGNLVRERWEQSYPVLLRKAGYFTAMAGKIGFEVAEKPEGKGVLPEGDFDVWGAGPGQTHYETAKNKSMAKYAKEYPHSTLSYGAFGRDFIELAAKGEKPFCLSISFKAPHQPVTPDPKFDAVYAGKTFKKPANYGRRAGLHFSEQSRQGRQYERFESWGYADKFDEVMAKYHQQIHAVDVAVGMIREALEKNGVEENTVVIFTSDNGFLCGVHGYGSKVLPYEEASRVPLVVYDPRSKKEGGRRSGALTGNVDMAPTIMELAGVEVPAGIDGKSVLPLYDDPAGSTHEWLPLINVWGPAKVQSFAVVTKKWKYIQWPYAGGGMVAAEELFQLAEDPLEMTNQAASASSRKALARMRGLYDGAVGDWRAKRVPWQGYEKYGTIFDRGVDWEKKAAEWKRR